MCGSHLSSARRCSPARWPHTTRVTFDAPFDTSELVAGGLESRVIHHVHLVAPPTRALLPPREPAHEAFATRAARSFTADATVAVLETVIAETGRWPANIRMDNGTELTAHAMRDWCWLSGIETAFIEPGSPWQNGFAESFNGRFRDEFLTCEQFDTLLEAQVLAEDWRIEYNTY